MFYVVNLQYVLVIFHSITFVHPHSLIVILS